MTEKETEVKEDLESDKTDETLLPPEYPTSGISIQAHKLWIGNIDKRITLEQLLKILRPFGEIRSMRYLFNTRGQSSREPRGYAFVEYPSRKEAQNAKKALRGKKALGQKLVVDWAKPDVVPSKNADVTSLTWCASDVSEPLPRSTSSNAKIEALEEKLKAMKQNNPPFPPSLPPPSQPSSTLPSLPSLPPPPRPPLLDSTSPRRPLLNSTPYARSPLLHVQPHPQPLLTSNTITSTRKKPYTIPNRTT